MDWLWIGVPASAVAAGLFAVALLRASRLLKPVENETRALAELGQVQSPSGRSFFPDGDAIWELAECLEDPRLRRIPRRPGQRRSAKNARNRSLDSAAKRPPATSGR